MMYLYEIALGVALMALCAGAWMVGRRMGVRLHADLVRHPQLGMVQAALLGLLSLLLGFCFAGAIGRFVQRQEILDREAGAITTLHRCADLLPESESEILAEQLERYAQARIALFNLSRLSSEEVIQTQLHDLLGQMWETVRRGTAQKPETLPVVVSAYLAMSTSLDERNDAERRHLPGEVMIGLIIASLACIWVAGLGAEVTDRRLRPPVFVLMGLIGLTLWTTVDLDFPRLGFIRLDGTALAQAAADLAAGL